VPTVLITGASRGIGRELSRQYAAEGWNVIPTCRNPDEADIAGAVRLDVKSAEDLGALTEMLGDTPIDLLVNNAGVSLQKNAVVGTIDYDAWEETFRVNTLAPIRIAEALAHHVAESSMKKMVFMSSVMGSIAGNGGGHYIYRSTKAALNAAMVSLAMELRGRGIISVSMHPGWVRTDMGGPSAAVSVEESAAGLRRVIAGIGPRDNGRFLDYKGAEIPW